MRFSGKLYWAFLDGGSAVEVWPLVFRSGLATTELSDASGTHGCALGGTALSNRRSVEDLKRLIPADRLKSLRAAAPAPKKPKRKPAVRRSTRRVLERTPTGSLVIKKPLPPSPYSVEELKLFKKALLARRREIVGDMATMEDEALRKNRLADGGEATKMPIHMADIGSDNYEQEFSIALIQNERQILKEIDEALQRIQDGTFGVCLATHQPISKPRLRAKPWARYCIEYKRAQEAQMRRGA